MENTKPVETKSTWPPIREIVITLILQVIIIANVAFLGYSYGVNRHVSATTPVEIQKQLPPTTMPISDQPVICTMDAKLCPDGSYVSRTGPHCEFTTCPTGTPLPIPTPLDGSTKPSQLR